MGERTYALNIDSVLLGFSKASLFHGSYETPHAEIGPSPPLSSIGSQGGQLQPHLPKDQSLPSLPQVPMPPFLQSEKLGGRGDTQTDKRQDVQS